MAVKLVLPFVFQNRASDYLEELSLTDERNRCVFVNHIPDTDPSQYPHVLTNQSLEEPC